MSALEDHPIDPIKNDWGGTVILFYPHEGFAIFMVIFRRERKTNMYVYVSKPKGQLCRPSTEKPKQLVVTGANEPLFYTTNTILHLTFPVCFNSLVLFSFFLFHLFCSSFPVDVFI